jgi:hypothetical protein
MDIQPERAINIFMSYAQENKDLKRELDNHLTALKESGQIAQFVERKVEPVQSLPDTDDGRERWKPVTAWADRDEAWWQVVHGIRHVVDHLRQSPRV